MPVTKSQPAMAGRNAFTSLPSEKEVLDSGDIARALGIGRKTAERKLRAGVFPGAFQEPRRWCLRRIDFTAYLLSKAQRRPA